MHKGGYMRLSKNNLALIGIVPIIFGIIIFYNFFRAIGILRPGGMTTYMIYYQLVFIGIAMFLGAAIYWGIIVYYIYLMQENEIVIQDNFVQLAGSGTVHLENAKKLIGKVLEDIKVPERIKPHQ